MLSLHAAHPRRQRARRALRDVRHRRPRRSAVEALEGRTAALLGGHGAVTYGDDLQAALDATELLEWACDVYVHACAIGTPRVLAEDDRLAVAAALADLRLRRPPRHVGVGTCLASRPDPGVDAPVRLDPRGPPGHVRYGVASVADDAPRRGAHDGDDRQTGHARLGCAAGSEGVAVETAGRRPLLISRGWVQVVILVILFGFFVLGLLAYRTYQAKPPVPQRTVDERGPRAVHRRATSPRASRCSCTTGSWSTGRSFGHGAYLGPDFTADYLRRSSNIVKRAYGGAGVRHRRAPDDRGLPDQPLRRADRDADAEPPRGRRRSTRSSATTAATSRTPTRSTACARRRSRTRRELRQLTAFFAWTAWAASTDRPGARLLVHEQLAAGAARRQQADGERRSCGRCCR